MLIERIEVEEGFLDGLDLRFTDGLNVLIGPRGSGKTSIIELIRFCLAVPGITTEQGARATKHAIDILGSGQVTVTAREHGEIIKISRTVQEPSPRATAPFPKPLIVSQSEIEEIGRQAASRLELVDRFRPRTGDRFAVADVAMIRSLTSEIQSALEELRQIDDEIAQLATVSSELEMLVKEQATVLGELTAKKEERNRLGLLSDEIGGANVRRDLIEVARSELGGWSSQIREIASRGRGLPHWPESARTTDWFVEARRTLDQSYAALRTAIELSAQTIATLDEMSNKNHELFVQLESEARGLRNVLENVQAGAGEIQRRIGTLKSQEARLGALHLRRKEKQLKLDDIKRRRGDLLNTLEDRSSQIFDERLQVAQSINEHLGPEIKVDVRQASRHDDYRSCIANVLRGAGLQQNVWAPKLAESLSPREFVEAVEASQTEVFVENVERMTERQAAKLISHVSGAELAGVLTCVVEDDATLSLFDGEGYKPTSELSVGQRCTVILPILLRDRIGPLMIDQPEDHLDNAYIVKTLVCRLIEQKNGSQIILSSHNANIPVLGGAENVIVLSSDGHRAFVQSAEPLDHPQSVAAITSLMEGGREAFEQRATFYRDHPANG